MHGDSPHLAAAASSCGHAITVRRPLWLDTTPTNSTLSLQRAEQNWGLSLTVGQSAQGPCRLHLAAPGKERSGWGPGVTG